MKKILITGGAGFIGSSFVKLSLASGYETIVIDKLTYAGDMQRLVGLKNDIKFYENDIADVHAINKIFAEEKPDAVVHFAAESHVDRSILDAGPFIDANVKGTQVLLDAAKNIGIERFINIATDEVYGDLGEDGTFYEDSPLKPSSPYSVSKTAADMLGGAYFRTYGLPVITLRPSNNYGPFQYPEKLIPVVFMKGLAGDKVPVYGKGENVREWLYVDDCAEGVMAALLKGQVGSAYNLGGRCERRNIEVVKAILKILGKGDELIEYVQDRPGHDFRYSLNSDKIYNETGWKAQITFEQGIETTINWYLENRDWTSAKLKYLKEFWQSVYKK